MPNEEMMQGFREILAKVEAALNQAGKTPDKIYWLPDPEKESQHTVGDNYKLVIGFGEKRSGYDFSRSSIEDFPSGASMEAETNIRDLVDSIIG